MFAACLPLVVSRLSLHPPSETTLNRIISLIGYLITMHNVDVATKTVLRVVQPCGLEMGAYMYVFLSDHSSVYYLLSRAHISALVLEVISQMYMCIP